MAAAGLLVMNDIWENCRLNHLFLKSGGHPLRLSAFLLHSQVEIHRKDSSKALGKSVLYLKMSHGGGRDKNLFFL